jgi:hypothetical protein
VELESASITAATQLDHTFAKGIMEMKLITNLICWGQLTKLPITILGELFTVCPIAVLTGKSDGNGQEQNVHPAAKEQVSRALQRGEGLWRRLRD